MTSMPALSRRARAMILAPRDRGRRGRSLATPEDADWCGGVASGVEYIGLRWVESLAGCRNSSG